MDCLIILCTKDGACSEDMLQIVLAMLNMHTSIW